MIWVVIAILAPTLTILGFLYLHSRFRKFYIVEKLSHGKRWIKNLLSAIPLLFFLVYGAFDIVNMVVILLHLTAFWLLGDLAGWIIFQIPWKKSFSQTTPNYWKGTAVLTLCALYLAVGVFQAYHVVETSYTLTTEKSLPSRRLRVAQIADCHIGATFDGESFGKHLARIQAQKPDLLVVTGDFIDDETSRKDMIAACKALGQVKTTYGTFFSYGNHDKGYYSHRGELESQLIANGICVLEDEITLIADTFYIIGRMDRDEALRHSFVADSTEKENTSPMVGRKSIEELTQSLDKSRYMIVLNHQPNDYKAEATAQVDLVLSGHTHGGQLIPLGPIGRWIGANDRTYGMEQRGNTTFLVTSGISNWALHFKTGAKAEYVIIDITEE